MAKIFIAFTINSTSDFFLVVRERDLPLAEVYRSEVLEPPHTQRNRTVDNLNPVMHMVELWTTLDGINLDLLKGRCDIDASLASGSALSIIQFIVNRGNGAPNYDPASDQDQYVNPDLDGKSYVVFKPGFGALDWDTHIQTITGGGFEFINGQQFSDGEEYTILVNESIITSEGTGKSFPSGVVEVTDDLSFGTSHYGKMLEINSNNTLVTVSIDDIDTIPEHTVFNINTHNGTQRYAVLQMPVGKYVQVNGQQHNTAYIGRSEEITLIKKGNYLRVVNWAGDYRRVGEYVSTGGLVPANGLALIGGWVAIADYPRLFYWYVNMLPVGELGTGVQDTTPDADNRTKWIIGTTKFWVKDVGGYFERSVDPDQNIDTGAVRKDGSNQIDDNKLHNHATGFYNRLSARASDLDSTNTPAAVDNANPTTEYRVAGMTTQRWADAEIKDQGTEARPKNVAVNKYVII